MPLSSGTMPLVSGTMPLSSGIFKTLRICSKLTNYDDCNMFPSIYLKFLKNRMPLMSDKNATFLRTLSGTMPLSSGIMPLMSGIMPLVSDTQKIIKKIL